MAAITFDVTRANGGGFDHDVQGSVANLKCMEIDCLATLAAKDDAGGVLELVLQEVQPLLYKSTGTAGKIFCIVDGHAVTAASLQERIQAKGTLDGITLGSATVTERDIDDFDAT